MLAYPPIHLIRNRPKRLGGIRILRLKIQQLPQPALLIHDAQALGIAQLKYQRRMAHRIVGGPFF